MHVAPPSIAVVMPYYHNEKTLTASLQSLCDQHGARAQEIIVVDDGDQSSAQVLVDSRPWTVPVTVLRSHRAGQSAATNAGIRAARADIILLTCADIIAGPTLLQEHLLGHTEGGDVAVLGHISYAPWLQMSPIMTYLQLPGVQFDFAHITDAHNVSGSLLYAPNASVRRSHLSDVGLFDAELTYGFQDCDLGLKLARLGVRFLYRKEAWVWHDHPNSPTAFAKRQRSVYALWATMAQRYPEAAELPSISMLLTRFIPLLPELDRLTALAEAANSRGWPRGEGLNEARTRLFSLFGTLGTLAMVQGIVSNRRGLEAVFDVPQQPWAKLLPKVPRPAPAAAAQHRCSEPCS